MTVHVQAQAPHIYDPSATLIHYSKLARQFEKAAEQSHESSFWQSTMEGVQKESARHEVNELLMDLAFGLSEGTDLHGVVTRAVRNGRAFNEDGVKMAAPDLLAPDKTPPQLVLTKSKAADKFMECAAYERMLRLVDIYDASLMCTVETFDAARALQADLYYGPRKEALDEVRRNLNLEIRWLKEHDPETRLLTHADYTPL
jgi:hypothetical protein